jgi:FKBP-type peptidyl-prolyl cis-trans isomerase FkpA
MRATRRSFVLLAFAAVFAGCGDSTTEPKEISLENQTWGSSLGINLSAMTKLASGVYIKDLVVGAGTVPVGPSSHILVIYTGYYASGVIFATNVGGAPTPFDMPGLIAGWQSGLLGVVAGGKRRLVIPSALAYGAAGNGPIPPYANLVFDVEVTATN